MVEVVALLISLNVIIGLAYSLIALLVLLAPLKFKFLRALGSPGFILAGFITMFFIACGWHHFDMAFHLAEGTSLLAEDLYHFIVPDIIQVVTAFGTVITGVVRGRFMLDRLIDEFIKHRNGEVELLEGEDE